MRTAIVLSAAIVAHAVDVLLTRGMKAVVAASNGAVEPGLFGLLASYLQIGPRP
jgi:hypothetical protein